MINKLKIKTRNEYDTVRVHIELLIKEATEGGYFSDPEGDNEYIQEFGRLARLSAMYEDEYMDFGFIIPKTKSAPNVQRGTVRFMSKQKEIAEEPIPV